jgi:hypothetical protein
LKWREEIERIGLNRVCDWFGWVCEAGLELVWIIGGWDNIFGRGSLRKEGGC